jgi:multidrug resistance efflux pump
MKLFGNGHARCEQRIDALEREVSKLSAALTAAQSEVAEVAERAYRLLKRAESRAKRELDGGATANQGLTTDGTPASGTPLFPPSRMTGARARIAARRLAAAQAPAPPTFDLSEGNGVHP